jgi:hypothetical protein
MVSYCAFSQAKPIQFIDSCKVILDDKILQYNKTYQDFELRFNSDESYIKLDFENDDVKPKRLKISELHNNIELINKKTSILFYSFVYDFIFNDYVIHKINLKCDSNIPKELENYISIVKCLKRGKLIKPAKATEIAKQNGLNEIFSYDLDDDPRWEGPNSYEENENKWKMTWTIRAKNFSKANKIGYSVIKIDAKNGKVLCKYLEFPTD